MSVTSYIGIGSNMGDRESAVQRAISLLREGGTVVAVSSLYCTEPVGYCGQREFINAVVALETDLMPLDLLRLCRSIEDTLGRKRTVHWGPRIIDLDILLFGEQLLSLPDLVVPHPLMAERRFVLVPLSEVAPDAVHPVLGKTVRLLLDELRDTSGVRKCGSDRTETGT